MLKNCLPIAQWLLVGAAAISCLSTTRGADAGEWPQILGPHRNGQATDEPELQKWGPAGPTSRWTYALGQGFAGPAVAAGRAIVFHRVGDYERVEALDVKTGQSLWKTDFPATYRGGVNPDSGPRCVPLIDEDRIYLFGAAGQLHAVQAEDGQKVWSRDTYREYRGQEGYFGAGATPILWQGRLLVNVGGRDAGLVAFDAATGETIWKSTDDDASYSSPAATTVGDQAMVIFVTRLNTVGVDPQSGEVLFQFPFGRSGPTVNAATPLVFDQHLFVSSSYGVGARLVKLSPRRVELVWQNEDVMASQYTTCVYHDGHLYGTHGREDYSNGELRCLDAMTGQLKWKAPQTGVAHTLLVGRHLLVLNNEGRLWLVDASPAAFKPLAEARVTTDTVRAIPALSNGSFYFRDNASRGGKLHALQLSDHTSSKR